METYVRLRFGLLHVPNSLAIREGGARCVIRSGREVALATLPTDIAVASSLTCGEYVKEDLGIMQRPRVVHPHWGLHCRSHALVRARLDSMSSMVLDGSSMTISSR
jgi:hypothetical protein